MKCPHCGKEFEPDENEENIKILYYPGVQLKEK